MPCLTWPVIPIFQQTSSSWIGWGIYYNKC